MAVDPLRYHPIFGLFSTPDPFLELRKCVKHSFFEPENLLIIQNRDKTSVAG